ncbi:hypothetical protein QTP88_008541 [Uroleucon formosanum]
MDHQQNNKTSTSNGNPAFGGDDDFNSEMIPGRNNQLEIAEHHIVQTVEDTQDVYKLTTDEFAFLNIVADTVRTAVAVRGNANEAPKQILATESLETDICEKSGRDEDSLVHISTTISQEGHIKKPPKTILSTLGRRLLKVGRLLCCWCSAVPPEDTD